jgi:putative transposase
VSNTSSRSIRTTERRIHINRQDLREKVMRGFKSTGHAQRFLSAFGVITSHFRVGRHLYGASAYRAVMKLRFLTVDEQSR